MKHISIMTILFFLVVSRANSQFAYLNPRPNATYINPQTTLAIRNAELMDASSIQKNQFIDLIGSISGQHSYSARLSDDGKTIVVRPKTNFVNGETVSVTIHGNELKTKSGAYVQGTNYSFQIREELSQEDEERGRNYILQLDKEAMGLDGDEASVRGPLDSLPPFTVTINTENAATGQIFFRNGNSLIANDTNCFPTIINNDGSVVFAQDMGEGGFDFEITHNGYLQYYSLIDDAHPWWFIMDSNYHVIDSLQCGNGDEENTNPHSCEIYPDGHAVLLAWDKRIVNMTQYGGQPNAQVTGMKIQELDANHDVVWEWDGWDHFQITDAISTVSLTGSTVDWIHANAVSRANDGNIILSSRHLDEVSKISHETGDFIWRLNGENNQFTFINDNIPQHFSYQHDARQMDNGDIMLFNNGKLLSPEKSSAKEYKIDEVNKIATLVWYYEHPNVNGFPVFGPAMGSSQRLPNGNTIIDWGTTNSQPDRPSFTEVDSNNNIVWEGKFDNYAECSYRVHKYVWKPCAIITPNHVKINRITDSSAKVSWSPVSNAESYDLQYRKIGTVNWNIKHVDGLSRKITRLKPNKTYEVQVRANCQNGYSADWSASKTFTTLPPKLINDDGSAVLYELYPNPAASTLFLDVESSPQQSIVFSICDITGKVVLSSKQNISGDQTLQFDIHSLPAGIYLAQIKQQDTIQTIKFVKE